MTYRRGALIVLEGCDRAGKSTQCNQLVQSLIQSNIKAELMSFPDRSTATGKILDNYLAKREDMTDKAIHLVFSANRWELEPKIVTAINAGTTLIVDRYSYSGVAFSAAKEGMDLEWCWKPEVGLPKPDAVFFLDLSPEALALRGGFGVERYENSAFQREVLKNYQKLRDDTWTTINADREQDVLQQELLQHILNVIDTSSHKLMKKLT